MRQQVIYGEGSTGKEVIAQVLLLLLVALSLRFLSRVMCAHFRSCFGQMYLLLSGELEITVRGERLGFLSDGSFFGETPILDEGAHAEVRRRTVTAMVDCKLCYLHKDEMKTMCDRYPELALRLKRCSRTETKVNKKGRKFLQAMNEASGGVRVSNLLGASFNLKNLTGGASPVARAASFDSSRDGFSDGASPTAQSGPGLVSPTSPVAMTAAMQAQMVEQAATLKAVLATQEKLMAAMERMERRSGDRSPPTEMLLAPAPTPALTPSGRVEEVEGEEVMPGQVNR